MTCCWDVREMLKLALTLVLSFSMFYPPKSYKILCPVIPVFNVASNDILSIDKEILVQFIKPKSHFPFLLV